LCAERTQQLAPLITTFLIASGFLCDPNDSTTCPAVARSATGEAIEISGAGTLALSNQYVTAAGAFVEKSATWEVVTSGVWTAVSLLGFESYGISPGALLPGYRRSRAFRLLPMGLAMMAGPIAAGGLAQIRVQLLPDADSPKTALLNITCANGHVPCSRSIDGISVAIDGSGPTFEEKVSGRTVFLLRRGPA
jgi:hypothetical protein